MSPRVVSGLGLSDDLVATRMITPVTTTTPTTPQNQGLV
jgi:hypothetical protein